MRKHTIKLIPFVLSVLGFFFTGLSLGQLWEELDTKLIVLISFEVFMFTVILLLSIGFPFFAEDKETTEIKL